MDTSATATPHRDRVPARVPMFATQKEVEKRHEAAMLRRTYHIGG